jgi:hypothetical protein
MPNFGYINAPGGKRVMTAVGYDPDHDGPISCKCGIPMFRSKSGRGTAYLSAYHGNGHKPDCIYGCPSLAAKNYVDRAEFGDYLMDSMMRILSGAHSVNADEGEHNGQNVAFRYRLTVRKLYGFFKFHAAEEKVCGCQIGTYYLIDDRSLLSEIHVLLKPTFVEAKCVAYFYDKPAQTLNLEINNESGRIRFVAEVPEKELFHEVINEVFLHRGERDDKGNYEAEVALVVLSTWQVDPCSSVLTFQGQISRRNLCLIIRRPKIGHTSIFGLARKKSSDSKGYTRR